MTDLHTRLANLWHTTHSLATLAAMLDVSEAQVRGLASESRLPYAPRMSIGQANEHDRQAIAADYAALTPNVVMQARYHLSASQMLRVPAQLNLSPRGYVTSDSQRDRMEMLFGVESSLADIARRMKLAVETLRDWYEARLREQRAAQPVKTHEPLPFGKFASEAQMRAAAERWGRMPKADVAAAVRMTQADLNAAVASVQRLNRLFPRAAYRRLQPAYNTVQSSDVAVEPQSEIRFTQPARWYESPWLVPSVADCFGYPLATVARAASLLGSRAMYAGLELFALLAMTQWLEEGPCPLHTFFQSLHLVSTSSTPGSAPTGGIATDALLKSPVLAYEIAEVTGGNARRLRNIVRVDFCLLRALGNLTPAATRPPLGVVPAGIRVVLAVLR